MVETLNYSNICEFWNGEVQIKEIKQFSDDRGMVGEIFRVDSELTHDSKMCYISETNSMIMRGPHEHKNQKDVFISWGSSCRMIYHLYNKKTDEMKFFITEPNKIYAVIVKAGIVHSYRNLSSTPIKTLNFPDALYKGVDKKEEIDEIRHEDKIKPIKNIWVLGADGRLGKVLVKSLFEKMGYHTYNVIPICEKFENDKVGLENLNNVLNMISKSKNSIIINCIAKTNVQDEFAEFNYENFLLPRFVAEFCVKNKVQFVNFSTDYIYQTGVISAYTKSKVMFETWLSTILDDEDMWGCQLSEIKQYIKVIRVANLFSLNPTDTRNVIYKVYSKLKDGKIVIPKNLTIMPTSVEQLSKYLINNYIFDYENKNQVIEVSGKAYDFYKFVDAFMKDFKYEVKENENPKTHNNTEMFLNNPHYNEIDCDADIIEKIKNIKELHG